MRLLKNELYKQLNVNKSMSQQNPFSLTLDTLGSLLYPMAINFY